MPNAQLVKKLPTCPECGNLMKWDRFNDAWDCGPEAEGGHGIWPVMFADVDVKDAFHYVTFTKQADGLWHADEKLIFGEGEFDQLQARLNHST